jgi:protein O-GlcNAcase/histone acetyltransferase
MVVEDEDGIVGYAVAILNVKSYNQKLAISWIPELRMKYPLDSNIGELPQNVQVCEY